MEYCVACKISEGLNCIKSYQKCTRSIQLDDRNLDDMFCLTYQKKNVTPHRISELAIQRIVVNPKKFDMIIYVHFLCIYGLDKISSQAIAVHIILAYIKKTNIYLGALLINFMMDQTSIKHLYK